MGYFKNKMINFIIETFNFSCNHLISISDFAKSELSSLLSLPNLKHHRIYLDMIILKKKRVI